MPSPTATISGRIIYMHNNSYAGNVNLTAWSYPQSPYMPQDILNSTLTNPDGTYSLFVNTSTQFEPFRPFTMFAKVYATDGNVTFVTPALPPAPPTDKSNVTLYLSPVVTVRVSPTFNGIQIGTGQYENCSFDGVVIDQQVAIPYEFFRNKTHPYDIVLPQDRNYSIVLMTPPPMPGVCEMGSPPKQINNAGGTGGLFTNTSAIDPNDLTQPTVRKLYPEMNFSRVVLTGFFHINGTAGPGDLIAPNITFQNPLIYVEIMQRNNYRFLPPDARFPFKALNSTDDFVNETTGEFRITLTSGSNYIVGGFANNNSNLSWGGYENFTNLGGDMQKNVTLYPFTGKRHNGNAVTNPLPGPDFMHADEITTNQITINVTSDVGGQAGSTAIMNAPLNLYVTYPGGMKIQWLLTGGRGSGEKSFSVPAGTGITLEAFNPGFAPIKLVFNSTQIQNYVLNNNSVVPVQMKRFDVRRPRRPGESNNNFSASSSGVRMQFLKSNSTCSVPNAPSSCNIGSGVDDARSFDPTNSIMLGKTDILMTQLTGRGNITIKYVGASLMSTAPPDAQYMDTPIAQSGDGRRETWRFGSSAPRIYDYALVAMPYNSSLVNENAQMRARIPLLYDQNGNVIYNKTDPALNTTPSDYDDYDDSWFNGSDVICSPTDQTGLCYQDKARDTIWMKMVHFSEVGPELEAGLPGAPNITLYYSPLNNSWKNNPWAYTDFNFSVSDDDFADLSCSLYVNGALNATNSSVVKDTNTTLKFNGQYSNATYAWSISCTDSSLMTTNTSVRTFTIDTTIPSIFITVPQAGWTNSLQLNFTAGHEFSGSTLSCNKTLNGVTTTIGNVIEPVPNVTTMSGVVPGANYLNVTCTDQAGNVNTSATVSFTYTTELLLSSCQDLNIANSRYLLTQNVNSSGTCFNILANNITLDGNGYTINYSQSAAGYAVGNPGGYNYTKLKNLKIVQGGTNTDAYAIYAYRMSNCSIINNTIITSNANGTGIYLVESSWNNISYNNITTFANQSHGIYLTSTSTSNTLSGNTIQLLGSEASRGIYFSAFSIFNSALGNTITTTSGGFNSRGIEADGSDSILSYNNISTLGAPGIFLTSNSITVFRNTITTSNAGAHGIEFYLSGKHIVSGNTITTSGITSEGIYSEGSYTNTILNNTITTLDSSSRGIYFHLGGSTTAYNNTITAAGAGIYLRETTTNLISGGSITSQSTDYLLEDTGDTNNFTNTGFTLQRRIGFTGSLMSYFNYNNQTAGGIWLKTRVVITPAYLNRTISRWNESLMVWNDTILGTNYAGYVLEGLLPNTSYKVYNTSGGVQTLSYLTATDANGNLNFAIGLNGATEIKVQAQYRPTINVQSPANITYNSTRTIDLNYTVSDDVAVSQCKYELNGGTNISLPGCANATITAADGGNYVRVWVNDSDNVWNSATTYFTVDLRAPSITSANVTPSRAYNGTSVLISAVATDAAISVFSVVANVTKPSGATYLVPLESFGSGLWANTTLVEEVGVYRAVLNATNVLGLSSLRNLTFLSAVNKTITYNITNSTGGKAPSISVTIIAPENNGTLNSSASANATLSVPQGTVTVRISDSSTNVTVDLPVNLTDVLSFNPVLQQENASAAIASAYNTPLLVQTIVPNVTIYTSATVKFNYSGWNIPAQEAYRLRLNKCSSYNSSSGACSDGWTELSSTVDNTSYLIYASVNSFSTFMLANKTSVCGNLITETGEQCDGGSSCSSDCTTIPSGCSGCGSGGTPSSTSTTAAPSAIKETKTISSIAPGAAATITISKAELLVSQITLESLVKAANVSVTVEKLDSKPGSITALPTTTGKIYKYLDISSSIAPVNLSKAKIKFRVETKWIASNNYSTSTVSLSRYSKGWSKLPTTFLSSDSNNSYFEAESPGFSTFAITGEKYVPPAPVEPPKPPEQPPVEKPVPVAPTPTALTPVAALVTQSDIDSATSSLNAINPQTDRARELLEQARALISRAQAALDNNEQATAKQLVDEANLMAQEAAGLKSVAVSKGKSGLFTILLILVILVVGAYAYTASPRTKDATSKLAALNEERRTIIQMKKNAEKEYLTRKIDRDSYDKMLSDYESRLIEVGTRIEKLEKGSN